MKKWFWFVPALCAVVFSSYALDIPGFTPDDYVVYKTIDGFDLKLEVFHPVGHTPSNSTPAILFFFGGGWSSGSPSQFHPHCQYLADRGMVAMSAEYRIENVHGTTPAECVKDGKSAIRWIREHAGQLGIDPGKLAAGGGSAGGHVAAATAALSGFNEAGEDLSASCIPDALVLFNPVVDNGPGGYGYDRVQAYWEDFSPLHNIHSNMPPTTFHLGTSDNLIPVSTGEAYQQSMQSFGLRCDLYLYEGREHGFFNYTNPEDYAETEAEMDRFLVSLGFLEEVPTRLKATAGDGSVSLEWDDSIAGAYDSYTVYRSTTSGSYSGPLTNGLGSSDYVDNTALNDTTYYYVVTGVDTNGSESGKSGEASATPAEPRTAVRYEAEAAFYSGAVLNTTQPGYSGTGYVDYQSASGEYIEWTVSSPVAGEAEFLFGYALKSGSRPLEIKVNGTVINASFDFPATGDWANWSETAPFTVSFVEGDNTIRATSIGSSGGNIDYLDVVLPEPALTGYELWASINGVGAATNDFDSDGLNNLYEYGLNGNPTNALDKGTLPVFSQSANRFLYVHPKRSDDTEITYAVETTTNLLDSGSWTGEGVDVVRINVTGETLDFVTNEVDIVEDEKFIRLKIEQKL